MLADKPNDIFITDNHKALPGYHIVIEFGLEKATIENKSGK